MSELAVRPIVDLAQESIQLASLVDAMAAVGLSIQRYGTDHYDATDMNAQLLNWGADTQLLVFCRRSLLSASCVFKPDWTITEHDAPNYITSREQDERRYTSFSMIAGQLAVQGDRRPNQQLVLENAITMAAGLRGRLHA